MLKTDDTKNGGEKMRVLRIAHASLTPALRQRERALARSYPAVDLEVLTTDTWREAELEVNAAADDLFPLRTARTYFSRHIQLFAYDPLPIIRALREHRPHLVDLNHEPYSIACAEILTLCQWFSPQSLIVMQTAQNILRRYPPPFKSLEKRAFRQVSAAYVCSETVREVLRAKGFIKPAVIIPFGVNTEAFRPSVTTRQRSEKGLTIGFVGRMLEAKGLKVLAYALAKLATDRWQLLAVGDGPDREEFARELAEAGLLDRVKFTGAVDYDLVPGYFHQMDMLVM